MFISTQSCDTNEISIRNFYKNTCALAFMPPQVIRKLWVMIMNECQNIEHIDVFYDDVTST